MATVTCSKLLTSAGIYVICVDWSLCSKYSERILICEQFNRIVPELIVPYDALMALLFKALFNS